MSDAAYQGGKYWPAERSRRDDEPWNSNHPRVVTPGETDDDKEAQRGPRRGESPRV